MNILNTLESITLIGLHGIIYVINYRKNCNELSQKTVGQPTDGKSILSNLLIQKSVKGACLKLSGF